jgi:hypothetical protein
VSSFRVSLIVIYTIISRMDLLTSLHAAPPKLFWFAQRHLDN